MVEWLQLKNPLSLFFYLGKEQHWIPFTFFALKECAGPPTLQTCKNNARCWSLESIYTHTHHHFHWPDPWERSCCRMLCGTCNPVVFMPPGNHLRGDVWVPSSIKPKNGGIITSFRHNHLGLHVGNIFFLCACGQLHERSLDRTKQLIMFR